MTNDTRPKEATMKIEFDTVYDEISQAIGQPVFEMPDIDTIEFDEELIAEFNMDDPQQRAEASRILFGRYNAAAIGIPKGSHSKNWNSLVHTRISRFLGRLRKAKQVEGKDVMRRKVSDEQAAKVADTAAISTQAALRVLKEEILTEDGEVDLAKFAELLKEA